MKRYVAIFVFIVLSFLLQTTVFENLKIAGTKPNLVLLIVAISGFMYGRGHGMFAGVVGGLFVDLMYRDVIGVTVIILSLIGYANGAFSAFYERDDHVVPLVYISISSFCYSIMFFVCNFMLRGRLAMNRYLIEVIIPELIYTLAAGVIAYGVFKWVDERLNPIVEERLDHSGDTNENAEL